MSQKASFEFLPEIVERFSEPGCETGVFTVRMCSLLCCCFLLFNQSCC